MDVKNLSVDFLIAREIFSIFEQVHLVVGGGKSILHVKLNLSHFLFSSRKISSCDR